MENVDILYSIVGGDKPPTLPLREERRTDGVELVFNARGVGETTVREQQHRKEASLLKKICRMEKRFQRSPCRNEPTENVRKALLKVNSLKSQLENSPSGISYSMYLEELKKSNQNRSNGCSAQHPMRVMDKIEDPTDPDLNNITSEKSMIASVKSRRLPMTNNNTEEVDNHFNKDSIDVCYSIVGNQKPPNLPLKEEMMIDGVELVYKKPERVRDTAPLKSRERTRVLPYYGYSEDQKSIRNRRIKTASSRISSHYKTEIMVNMMQTVNSSLTEDTYARDFHFDNVVKPSTYSRNGCFYYPPIKNTPLESSSQWSTAGDSVLSGRIEKHHGYKCIDEESTVNLDGYMGCAPMGLHCSLDDRIKDGHRAATHVCGFNGCEYKVGEDEIQPLPPAQSFDVSKCRYDDEDGIDKYGIDSVCDMTQDKSTCRYNQADDIDKYGLDDIDKSTIGNESIFDNAAQDQCLSRVCASKDGIENGAETADYKNATSKSTTLQHGGENRTDYGDGFETNVLEVEGQTTETKSVDLSSLSCSFIKKEVEVKESEDMNGDDRSTQASLLEIECENAEGKDIDILNRSSCNSTENAEEEEEEGYEDRQAIETNDVEEKCNVVETQDIDPLLDSTLVANDYTTETNVEEKCDAAECNYTDVANATRNEEEECKGIVGGCHATETNIIDDEQKVSESLSVDLQSHSYNSVQNEEVEPKYEDIFDDCHDSETNTMEDECKNGGSNSVDLLKPLLNSTTNEEEEAKHDEVIEDGHATETNIVEDECGSPEFATDESKCKDAIGDEETNVVEGCEREQKALQNSSCNSTTNEEDEVKHEEDIQDGHATDAYVVEDKSESPEVVMGESKCEDAIEDEETNVVEGHAKEERDLQYSSCNSATNEEEETKQEEDIEDGHAAETNVVEEESETSDVAMEESNCEEREGEERREIIVDTHAEMNVVEDGCKISETFNVDRLDCPCDSADMIVGSCTSLTKSITSETTSKDLSHLSHNFTKNQGEEYENIIEDSHSPMTKEPEDHCRTVESMGVDCVNPRGNGFEECDSLQEEENNCNDDDVRTTESYAIEDKHEVVETPKPNAEEEHKDVIAAGTNFVQDKHKTGGTKTIGTFSHYFVINNASRTTSYTCTTYDSTQSFDASNNDISREGDELDEKCAESTGKAVNDVSESEVTDSMQSFDLSINCSGPEISDVEDLILSENSTQGTLGESNKSVDLSIDGTIEEGQNAVENSSEGSADTILVDNTNTNTNTNRSKVPRAEEPNEEETKDSIKSITNVENDLASSENFLTTDTTGESIGIDDRSVENYPQEKATRNNGVESNTASGSELLGPQSAKVDGGEKINESQKDTSSTEDSGAITRLSDASANAFSTEDNNMQSNRGHETSSKGNRILKENKVIEVALPPRRGGSGRPDLVVSIPPPERDSSQLDHSRKVLPEIRIKREQPISPMSTMSTMSTRGGSTFNFDRRLDMDSTTNISSERRSRSVPTFLRDKMSGSRYANSNANNKKSKRRNVKSVHRTRRETERNKLILPRANFGVSVFATSACRPFA